MSGEPRQLVLMGLRGSGKSTIGRLVAQRTGRTFIDLDDLTAKRLGTSTVANAWHTHDQARFRVEETAALEEILGRAGTVFALGGGTPTAPGATELLEGARASGTVRLVYLRAMPDVLRTRLSATKLASRPSITGAAPLDEIEAVFAARDSLYTQLAETVLDAGASAEATAKTLIDSMRAAS